MRESVREGEKKRSEDLSFSLDEPIFIFTICWIVNVTSGQTIQIVKFVDILGSTVACVTLDKD